MNISFIDCVKNDMDSKYEPARDCAKTVLFLIYMIHLNPSNLG